MPDVASATPLARLIIVATLSFSLLRHAAMLPPLRFRHADFRRRLYYAHVDAGAARHISILCLTPRRLCADI